MTVSSAESSQAGSETSESDDRLDTGDRILRLMTARDAGKALLPVRRSRRFRLPGLFNVLWVFPFVACAATASVSDLAWMTGCWQSVGGEEGSVEIWMAPAGGIMLGMNRSMRDGKASGYEFMRIIEKADGSLVFVASPSGQDSATFTVADLGSGNVVFENSAHDFPQRIIYRLISDDHLLGRIEGSIDGETRAIDFPMSRTSCE